MNWEWTVSSLPPGLIAMGTSMRRWPMDYPQRLAGRLTGNTSQSRHNPPVRRNIMPTDLLSGPKHDELKLFPDNTLDSN